MADWGQFEEMDDAVAERANERPVACQVCEAMLPDAVDGTLSEAEQRAFNRHVAGCVVCARELEEAQRGAAWLGMLKQQAPEPSPLLLDRILAQTTGAQAAVSEAVALSAPVVAAAAPVWASLPAGLPNGSPIVLPVRPMARKASAWQTLTGTFSLDWMRPLLQPRLAMTAAMAFCSIALTLNLTGVRLSSVTAASLRPSVVRRTVADRGAAAVRSFQNMRVVYQTEARMSDLRSSWQAPDDQAGSEAAPEAPSQAGPGAAKPQGQVPDKQPGPDKPQGSSQLDFAPVDLRGAGMTRKGA